MDSNPDFRFRDAYMYLKECMPFLQHPMSPDEREAFTLLAELCVEIADFWKEMH
jgi:hypothetical protein